VTSYHPELTVLSYEYSYKLYTVLYRCVRVSARVFMYVACALYGTYTGEIYNSVCLRSCLIHSLITQSAVVCVVKHQQRVRAVRAYVSTYCSSKEVST